MRAEITWCGPDFPVMTPVEPVELDLCRLQADLEYRSQYRTAVLDGSDGFVVFHKDDIDDALQMLRDAGENPCVIDWLPGDPPPTRSPRDVV